jgi:hypothetical protein
MAAVPFTRDPRPLTLSISSMVCLDLGAAAAAHYIRGASHFSSRFRFSFSTRTINEANNQAIQSPSDHSFIYS